MSGFGFRVSGVGRRIACFGNLSTRVSGFGFRVSGFGCWVLGVGIEGWYLDDSGRASRAVIEGLTRHDDTRKVCHEPSDLMRKQP